MCAVNAGAPAKGKGAAHRLVAVMNFGAKFQEGSAHPSWKELVKRFDRIDKIFKIDKIVLHPNLVNRANHVNPVQSSFSPHAACGLDVDTKV